MSLLLDALKKAAEDKLQKQQDDNTVDAGTTVTPTDVQVKTIQIDITDTDSTSDQIDVDEDLTSFDIEPLESTADNAFSISNTTEAGDSRIYVDSTEIGTTVTKSNNITAPNSSDRDGSQQAEQDDTLRAELEALGGASTVIGKTSERSLNLDVTDIDLTQSALHQTDAGAVDSRPQKNSLTENMLLRGYQPSAQKASNLFDLNNEQDKHTLRLFLLLALVLVVGLGVVGLYAYDYFVVSRQQDLNLSYKHLLRPDKITDTDNALVNQKADEVGIIVKQEDYVVLLDQEFEALENSENADQKKASSTVAAVKATTISNNKKSHKTGKPITIRKTARREPLQEVILRGYHAFNSGDFAAAKTAYQEAARRQPYNRDVQLGLAALAVQQNNIDQARIVYAELLKQNPSDPAALVGLTALGPVSANSEVATTSAFKLMLEQQPEAPHVYFALGNSYAEQQRWPEAQQAFFEAYRRDDQNADYAYNLAVSLDHLGQQNAALNFYQEALLLAAIKTSSVPTAAAEQRIADMTTQQP